MRKATVENIDALIEFDTVFNLSPNPMAENSAVYRDALDYAPGYALGHIPEVKQDAYVDEHGHVHVTGDAWISQPNKLFTDERWSFYSQGYTGQAFTSSSDPCMYYGVDTLGGRLAQDMIEEGGTFVMVRVQLDTDTEEEHEPESWVILRMDD